MAGTKEEREKEKRKEKEEKKGRKKGGYDERSIINILSSPPPASCMHTTKVFYFRPAM